MTSCQPSEWCLVGDVVEAHALGESKEIRRGSEHFSTGTKAYCLPPKWGDGYEKAIVVGLAGSSRRWITVVMPSAHITNWRGKVVYKPAVLRRLREGCNGFSHQWTSWKEVESWAEGMRRRANGNGGVKRR